MNALMKAIDRFCYRHPRFGIRRLMLYVVIGNAIVYLFTQMDRTGLFAGYLYFNWDLILQGQVWRLVSFVFVPMSSGLLFEALSLYFYYFIGNALEDHWGTGRFTIFYFSGALFTMIYGVVVSAVTHSYVLVSAEYLNLSMFFAFAALYPEMRVMLFFIIPIKIKWLALVDAAMFVYSMVINPFPMNLLPLIAMLNFFIFFGQMFIGLFRTGTAARAKTVHFRTAARQAKYQAEHAPYRHKCAVCGKTDVSHPGTEFRYCSLCQGYHCFCSDHINNHIHFTE